MTMTIMTLIHGVIFSVLYCNDFYTCRTQELSETIDSLNEELFTCKQELKETGIKLNEPSLALTRLQEELRNIKVRKNGSVFLLNNMLLRRRGNRGTGVKKVTKGPKGRDVHVVCVD